MPAVKRPSKSASTRVHASASPPGAPAGRAGQRVVRNTAPHRSDRIVRGVRRSIESGAISSDLRRLTTTWARLWDASILLDPIAIRRNDRLRTTVARWVIARQCIEVGPTFLTLNRGHVEILCHECAHAAVAAQHGHTAAPHGPEWRRLVSLAGYPHLPRTLKRKGSPAIAARRSRTRSFEHRCQVCHAVRYAKKRVATWRCVECAAAGLSGALRITELRLPGTSN